MATVRADAQQSVVAFLDVGTYSIRLLLVRFNPNQSYTILSELKEPVRLGGEEFGGNWLQPEAMERAVLVCQRFAAMARKNGADELVAVATSATREAENQREFLRRLRDDAHLEVRIISGREEARLVYLGVSRGLHIEGKTGLFLDIGGGSTELAVGDARDFKYLDSLKLGSIRLTQMFQLDQPDPISADRYQIVRNYVRSAAIRTIQHIKPLPFDLAIGSSGTTRNLAGIADKRRADDATGKSALPGNRSGHQTRQSEKGGSGSSGRAGHQTRQSPLAGLAASSSAGPGAANGDPTLSRAELAAIATLLRNTPLAERRKIPGLNPDRADVILAGAAILEVLMEELNIKQLATTRLGLRDGLLINYLIRSKHHDSTIYELSARRRSVLLLGRRCGFDEKHAQAVARLALELFDSARQLGLHRFGDRERELLEFAGLLHDIGVFLSFVNHQAHTYYLIRHADLVGFDQMEIALIAALARYHRKGRPRLEDPEFAELDKRSRLVLSRLYVLLRLAERLERSHHGVIQKARFKRGDGTQRGPVSQRGTASRRGAASQRGAVASDLRVRRPEPERKRGNAPRSEPEAQARVESEPRAQRGASSLRRGPTIRLQITADGDCSLELQAIEKDQKAFARAFRAQLVVERA